MFPREWRAKPREDVDTSMIGRIWRRVMQIRGSAGVDLMARAQVRAHREPCGPRQWIPPAREGGGAGTVLAMGPRFSPFLRFRAICPARCSSTRKKKYSKKCAYLRNIISIGCLDDRF